MKHLGVVCAHRVVRVGFSHGVGLGARRPAPASLVGELGSRYSKPRVTLSTSMP